MSENFSLFDVEDGEQMVDLGEIMNTVSSSRSRISQVPIPQLDVDVDVDDEDVENNVMNLSTLSSGHKDLPEFFQVAHFLDKRTSHLPLKYFKHAELYETFKRCFEEWKAKFAPRPNSNSSSPRRDSRTANSDITFDPEQYPMYNLVQNQPQQPQQPSETSVDELERYKEEPALAMKDDPLKWWRENGYKYPMLSKMARMYLGVVATSTPSERVFSCAGRIISKFRSKLAPKTASNIVFLNKNKDLN